MYETQYPTTKDILAQQRFRRNRSTVIFAIVLSAILGLMTALTYLTPHAAEQRILIIGIGVSIILAVPIIIWNFPRAGLFMVFIGTTLFDVEPGILNTQKLTAMFPFFLNFNNIGSNYGTGIFEPVKFSPAELIIIFTLIVWLVRTIATRNFKFISGPFMGVLLLFGLTTLMGLAHGYTSGGDFQMGLWEVRPQFQPLIMYILTINLITERKHVRQMLWIAVIGIGLLSVVGVISYFQLNGMVSEQGILDHEDSLIVDAFLMVYLYLVVSKADRNMSRVGFVFLPCAIFTLLENQRRAGIAALIVALIISLPILYVIIKERRTQIARIIAVFALFLSIYLPVAWNAEGAWALPARSIRSTTAPSDRDASSDVYRIMEDADLKYTRSTSPLIGYGYGKPFIQIETLPNVSTYFLSYFAHDSVLWLWMSTGHIGFFAFMLLVATVCIKGLHICRETRDPLLISAGLMGIIFLIMAYVYGKYDLQLTNPRTMTMVGVWLGLLGVVPTLTKTEQETNVNNSDPNPDDQDPLLFDGSVFMADDLHLTR